MKIDITRQPIVIILLQIGLVVALAWYGYVLHPDPREEVVEMGVAVGDWVNGVAGSYPITGTVVSMLVLFMGAFVITRTISRMMVFPSRTHLPAIFYIIVCCAIYYMGQDLAAILASYLLILSATALFSSFVREDTFGTTFKAAFMLGITPLLNPQAVVLLLLVPIAMVIFKRRGREILVAMIGSVMPLLISAYITWAVGGGFTEVFVGLWHQLMAGAEGVMVMANYSTIGILRGVILAEIALITVASIAIFALTSGRMRKRPYKMQIFMICFLVLTCAMLLLPSASAANLTFLAIPVAYIAPIFFVRLRGAVSATAYFILITTVLLKLLLVLQAVT